MALAGMRPLLKLQSLWLYLPLLTLLPEASFIDTILPWVSSHTLAAIFSFLCKIQWVVLKPGDGCIGGWSSILLCVLDFPK